MVRVVALAVALLPVVWAVPSSIRDGCTADWQRCAGAPGKQYVPWLGCCGGPAVDCVAHPDYATDPENLWGRYCIPVGYSAGGGSPSNGYYPTYPTHTSPVSPGSDGGEVEEVDGGAEDYGDDNGGDGGEDSGESYSDGSDKSDGNPLAGMPMYVNPSFKADIDTSLSSAESGAEKDNLAKMRNVASAYWLDFKYKVIAGNDSTTDTAEGILKDASKKSPVPLVSLIVYDLPNRDCHAKASNGEICCSSKKNPDGTCNYLDNEGECADGLEDYKTNYIDQLAISVKKYCDKVPLALFIEPDSLPNLVTNTDDPKCGGAATQASYRQGITYAVTSLAAACPRATIYVDGAHGGWLGWPDNLSKFSTEINSLGISQHIRGFSLNVANYQPLGVKCPSVGHCLNGQNPDDPCCNDPCGLSAQYNPAHSELNYAMALGEAMRNAISGFTPHFVIDTGRNGQNSRQECSNWCNVRGAGSGVLPTTMTGYPEAVDAYMWLKTPGESDGCTQTLPTGGQCPRFDADCASEDSIGTRDGEPLAPEAGGWFDYQIKMLAKNAKFDG